MLPKRGVSFVVVLVFSLIASETALGQHPRRATGSIEALPQSTIAEQSGFRYTPKKPGHYTAQDWRAAIDATWGEGLSTSQKLAIFDKAWLAIDASFAAFQGLSVNWDSLKTVYRPEIESGVSRGRFAAIMNYLFLPLQDYHAVIWDTPVMATPLEPGVPLLFLGGNADNTSHFGASLTPLPDSSLLVFKALPNHPLGLEPGDIVLGYDGIPWKDEVRDLMAAQLPLCLGWSVPNGDIRGLWHNILCGAGMNWHLFDTIDCVKYATGDTVHYATAALDGQTGFIWGNEQLPVPGVDWVFDGSTNMTDPFGFGDYISWGIVQGTHVGYIYAVGWGDNYAYPGANISAQFHDAVNQLVSVENVDGLIIDQRLNYGGAGWAYQDGLSLLFASTFKSYGYDKRGPDASDHFQMVHEHMFDSYLVTHGTPPLFDRPIAILVGPAAMSVGDAFPYVMKAHPMARLFGLPTNGSNTGPLFADPLADFPDWYMLNAEVSAYEEANPGVHLAHTPIEPDEEVWLTRNGVVSGQDDVVVRALEWISTLSYAHNVHVSLEGADTVHVTAMVENPLAHLLNVVAGVADTTGTVSDSTLLYNDGLHGDGAADDSIWGGLYLPTTESVYYVSVRTDDITTGTSRNLPDAARFIFTRMPIISLDTRPVQLGTIYHVLSQFDTTFQVTNLGGGSDSVYVALDPVLTPDSAIGVSPTSFALPAGGSQDVTFSVFPHRLSKGVSYNAVVMVDSRFGFGQTHFEKTFVFGVTPVSEEPSLPTVYALHQNYPNPFNPATTIEYALPHAGFVTLRVYNVLGEEVATLVDGQQAAGAFKTAWNASQLPSGVYFYRLTAGDYVQTRRMVLMR